MKLPIRYALADAEHLPYSGARLSLTQYGTLTFEAVDAEKFPCINYARLALERGGNTACVINAANEIAVEAFLKSRIGFTRIPHLIDETLERADFVAAPDYDDYVASNAGARIIAAEIAGVMAATSVHYQV